MGRTTRSTLPAWLTVDLILTGHDHDLFINYDERSAMVELSYDAHSIVIVEATIEVSEAKGQRSIKWQPQFRVIDTCNRDSRPGGRCGRREVRKRTHPRDGRAASRTAIELDSRNSTVRAREEAAIGNLFADAMRVSAKADIGLINGGNIRGGRVYAADSLITRRDRL